MHSASKKTRRIRSRKTVRRSRKLKRTKRKSARRPLKKSQMKHVDPLLQNLYRYYMGLPGESTPMKQAPQSNLTTPSSSKQSSTKKLYGTGREMRGAEFDGILGHTALDYDDPFGEPSRSPAKKIQNK